MKYKIHIHAIPGTSEHHPLLRSVAERCMEAQKADPGEVAIVLTDSSTIQALNRKYLGLDRPTDVLSFPNDTLDPDTGLRYYGDLIISLPQAEAQAAEASHELSNELVLLTVHGMLHLLGYDHEQLADKETMWSAQNEILNQLGLGSINLPE